MFKSVKKVFSKTIVGLLVSTAFAVAPLAIQAATTNTFNFNDTTLGANNDGSNPVNGPLAFYGTNLAAGDVIVFDGIVIDNNPSDSGDWGAVDFNAGGTGGLTSATLGVMARDGTHVAANFLCSVWTSGTSVNVGYNPTPATNRIRVEITCTETGSTTNMNYNVFIDQGVTNGTFNVITNRGSSITFPNNVVSLRFGTRNQPHTFIQNLPMIAVSAPTPATNTVAAGVPATFTANIKGWPRSTTQQWLSNGVPIIGATGLTYTTPATTASYNGAQYSVIVSNQLNSANVVTSSPAVLIIGRTTPGIVTFNFPTTTVQAGGGAVTDPGVSISGALLLAGDTVVFDGIVIPNGAQASDAWTAINVAGSGYGNVTSAKLGVLCRLGTGPSQLFINGGSASNPTSGGTMTNRVRIELYPSANGSTTNMGWLVEIDQNLSGTFQPAVTGTNLTFVNNTLPLTFGSSGASSIVIQNPQSPVSIFSGPSPAFQVVAVGSPISVGVTVQGWSPAFQWRKNGAAILNATNRTYTLASVSLADNGDQFTVVVSNRLNSLNVVTSAVANVSVLIPNNLSWYPTIDFTTWDTATLNWTTNGGLSQTNFSSGNNVTFDSLGYNIGGQYVTVTNAVNPSAVTVNATSYETYVLTGAGSVNGQNLLLTGDGTGTLYLQTPAAASFASATITNATLQVGYLGMDGAFDANYITNNGTIDFANTAGTLIISGVITGSGSIIQDGAGVTVLTATNSAYTIGAINNGILVIASTPNPGDILNTSELQPNSAMSVLPIPNAMTGFGHYYFTGFQTTILTGVSSHTGINQLFWSDVIVDNPQALGDANGGASTVSGADRVGGLYLSNNITWSQMLELDPRLNTGSAATAPHISNWSGTNTIISPLFFATGQGGSEINVEATTGLLTIDATSTLANNAGNNANNLNLQGAASGVWNGVLMDSTTALNVVKRGTGTWTLGGVNTYSGITTVANGTLLINGQIGAGDVSVQTGATLGGNGDIGGAVTVAAGGTVAPGIGIGTLTINNNLTLASGSFTRMEINKTAATKDQIVGVNSLAYGGTLVVSNLSGTLTTSDSFKLFTASSYAGAFASIVPAPAAGLAWNASTLATDGTLRIVAGNPSPGPITNSVVGGILKLSWSPLDIGNYQLQAQTNTLSVGLSTNWVVVPGSINTNKMDFPINTGNGSVFFRLANP